MKTKTVDISFGGHILVCTIQYETYRPETYTQPAEGGIEDFTVSSIKYGHAQINISALLLDLCYEIIEEKILDELKKAV